MIEEYFTEEEIALMCAFPSQYINIIKLIMANRKRIVDLEKRLKEVEDSKVYIPVETIEKIKAEVEVKNEGR